jgi:hypothetical protein
MLYKPAFCLAAMLCLFVTVTHAQSVDTLSGKLANFPSRLFSKVQTHSASLNQQITSQTQKYLAQMARREQRMQRQLSAVDSNSAKTLFDGSQQQYAALAAQVRGDTGNRKVSLSGQYVPYADTLQGAMAFLQKYPQVLAKGTSVINSGALTGPSGSVPGSNAVSTTAAGISPQVQAKLQGAASQFQALQAKMQDADIVKAYVQSRQQQITQYLSQHMALAGVLGKQIAGMQQAQYYYGQRLQQYKAMFSDPGALAQQALSMLGKLPAFQHFMQANSQLGSLFHVPGTYSTAAALNGVQTKAQIAQLVQSQISAAGPSGASALQANLQSAQSQLDGYKDKLTKLGVGNGDAQMPNFKPNDQKTKNFLGRLQLGFNFQTTHNSYYYPSLLSLAVSVGYKLGHSNVVGVGASYVMGTGNGIRDIRFTSNGLGLRTFINIKIKGSFSASGGFEYNYTTPFTSYQQLKQIQYWQRSGLLGVTKTISMKSKLLKQTTLSALWDLLAAQNVPKTQAFLFRIGYTF